MLQVVELGEDEDDVEEEKEALVKSTHVTDPVEDAVDVAIDPVKRQIKFK